MAKNKKISINAFENIVKEKFLNTFTANWNGLDITFTYTIGLEDVLAIVEEVSDNCFLSDGKFIPGVMMPLLYGAVISRYTNLSMPSNLSARYDLIARSGIMEFIMDNINIDQFNQIVDAVERKVDYMCESNTVEFNRAVDKLTGSLGEMKSQTEELLSGIKAEDIKRVMKFMSNDGAKEEKVTEGYLQLFKNGKDA